MKRMSWVPHLRVVMQVAVTQAPLRAPMRVLLQRIWVAERHHQIWEGAEPLRVAIWEAAERLRRRAEHLISK
jgi:hypothetical protein